MGSWLDVDPGLNTENDAGKSTFAGGRGEKLDAASD
jgi:hypothetical protein